VAFRECSLILQDLVDEKKPKADKQSRIDGMNEFKSIANRVSFIMYNLYYQIENKLSLQTLFHEKDIEKTGFGINYRVNFF
jgi:hypothetical protein